MSHNSPDRGTYSAGVMGAPSAHLAVLGMPVDDARRHLAGHGLSLVVIMRDGVEVPGADLKARAAVWVAVRGTKVDRLLART